MGMSINRFARLNPVDKGTISRYLNGQRVPRDQWFLDQLLAIQADNGKPVTPAVREHLRRLHLHALQTAHPHEYQVRLVRDELRIAHTSKQEAERYARALEEQLAERNRRIQELTDDKRRLRAAWDADRIAMEAEYERLTGEVNEIMRQLGLARERAAWAERRCQQLEDLLDRLDTLPSADKDGTGTSFPVHDPDTVASQLARFREMGLDDQVTVLAERAAAQAPVSDVCKLVRLLATLHAVGAIDQASRLARRAADQGRLDREDMRRLEGRALVTLLMTLHAVHADDLVRRLASDAISCAWRGDKLDVEGMLLVLRSAGASDEATELARNSWQLRDKSVRTGPKSDKERALTA
jgi:hypothetical protein